MAEKVGDAYVDLGTRDGKFNRGMGKAEKRTQAFAKGGMIAVAAITAIGGAMGKQIKLSNTQEDAERDIGSALRAHGDDAEKLLPILKKQAAAIQKLTRFGDEQNLQTMATLRNLGVQGAALGTATKQAIGLAKALGLDSNAAAKYTALARQGEFTILQRYVPALRTATTEAEKQAIVVELMNRGWKQAQESAQTTSGQIDQMSNAFGDLGETIGDLFKKSGVFTGGIKNATILIENMDKALKGLNATSDNSKKSSDGLGNSFLDAWRIAGGFTGALAGGSSIEEASEIAFQNMIDESVDRIKRIRNKGIQDIEAEKAEKAAASEKAKTLAEIESLKARRKTISDAPENPAFKDPGFTFSSFENAIKSIQSGSGKDRAAEADKKKIAALQSIDDEIKKLTNKPAAPVVGV